MRRLLIVAILVVGLLPASMVASANSDQVQSLEQARTAWSDTHPEADFDAAVDYQRRFRSEFDFTAADDLAIATSMAAATDNGSYEKYGLHLSDEEMTELDRRGRISALLTPIADAFIGSGLSEEDLPVETFVEDGADGDKASSYSRLMPSDIWGDAFAGAWIDQQDGGRIRIAVVDGATGAGAASSRASSVAAALVGSGRLAAGDFELVPAKFSYAALLAAQEQWLAQALDAGVARDAAGFSSDIDLKANQLVVFWGSDSQHKFAQAFAKAMPEGMVRLGGVGMKVVERGHPASNHGAPHAGLIFHLDKFNTTAHTESCTWGLTARTTDYIYAITAAHCSPYRGDEIDNPPSYWEWANYTISTASGGYRHDTYHGARDIGEDGWTYGRHYQRGDIMRVEITEEINVADLDCYHSASDCGTRIIRREYTTETLPGETKCASLPFSSPSYQCATLTTNNYQTGNRAWIRHTNHETNGGDSGAGLKEGPYATGILGAGAGGGGSLWTHAYYVEVTLGTTICGTSGECS